MECSAGSLFCRIQVSWIVQSRSRTPGHQRIFNLLFADLFCSHSLSGKNLQRRTFSCRPARPRNGYRYGLATSRGWHERTADTTSRKLGRTAFNRDHVGQIVVILKRRKTFWIFHEGIWGFHAAVCTIWYRFRLCNRRTPGASTAQQALRTQRFAFQHRILHRQQNNAPTKGATRPGKSALGGCAEGLDWRFYLPLNHSSFWSYGLNALTRIFGYN